MEELHTPKAYIHIQTYTDIFTTVCICSTKQSPSTEVQIKSFMKKQNNTGIS